MQVSSSNNNDSIRGCNVVYCLMHFFPFFSFPGSSSETLLQKFNSVHKDNKFYEMPQRKENAFIVRHYAGRVKYQVIFYVLI